MTTALRTGSSPLAHIQGGRFQMGSDDGYPEERPAQQVEVAPFLMETTPVTNRQFAEFVADSGYVTDAERGPDPALYPGIANDALIAGSAVFKPPAGLVELDDPQQWWSFVPGASWQHPEGPRSDLSQRQSHPVVHVSLNDATAYARWVGRSLPTEQEWECAARAGSSTRYVWGDELLVDGRIPANVWGFDFPCRPGPWTFGTTEPGTYPANRAGLYDMIGNVWEWTTTPYTDGHRLNACCHHADEHGGSVDRDPLQLGAGLAVVKGGSFLCAENYCARYRPAARIPQTADSTASNVGFRCIVRP